MKITIDNHDGLGAVDYSECLSGAGSFRLHRKLNEPSVCALRLDCNFAGRAVPARYGRVIASSDTGVVLFTGYVALEPEAVLAGTGVQGFLYVQHLTALGDDLLLDLQSVPVTAGSTGLEVLQLMQALTSRVDPTRIALAPGSIANVVSSFRADADESWSANAGSLVAMARAGYRVVNGQLSVLPIGSTVHALSDTTGALNVAGFAIAQTKSLANDITLCGESEPQEYVTDLFQGDGSTTTFQLTRTPLRVSAVKGRLILDAFAGPALNPSLWTVNDPSSHFSITAAGLSVSGGSGIDGQTTLCAIDNVEMGGTLVLTMGGVEASAGSDGYIGCLYGGSAMLANLFAGFHIKQSGGGTVVVPVVQGVESGVSATLTAGHAYSFSLRFQCAEMQRAMASYYVDPGTGEELFGGGQIAMPANLVFEVQDTTGGVNQPTLVLYDGAVSASPATCICCAINDTHFIGSVQSVALELTGTTWVRSLQNTGSAFTRRIGLATSGADCKLESTGKLVFYATSVPQVGEIVTVTYRTSGKSVARLMNAASIAAQGTAAIPGVSRWIGSVVRPAARSSADCENAALALLQVSTSSTAAWAGTYEASNPQQGASGDIWPGDALAIQSAALGVTADLIVRTVTVANELGSPELLTYKIAFANDWAEAVGVKTSNAVPKDAWLPQMAIAAPTALSSLSALTVAVTGTQLNVSTGVAPPLGGGFEVRRVDWQFGPGSDGTLALRSPAGNFTIVREAAIEQYYVRMYDGSTPPNYSRFSSAICATVLL